MLERAKASESHPGQHYQEQIMAAASSSLTIASYNIHKGLSHFNRRLVLEEVREGLSRTSSDIVFLQEVQGNRHKPARPHHGPSVPQHEFLRDGGYSDVVYGQNATYENGHHGNAVLSRFPILDWENIDISHHPLESRGLLHTRVQIPGWPPLHCVCVHLGLWARSRRFQLKHICDRIREHVPDKEPLIVAGDFNDWLRQASNVLAHELRMTEAFEHIHGAPARTYPASLPLLQLDRIYVRDLKISAAHLLCEGPWAKLSDHAALVAEVTLA